MQPQYAVHPGTGPFRRAAISHAYRILHAVRSPKSHARLCRRLGLQPAPKSRVFPRVGRADRLPDTESTYEISIMQQKASMKSRLGMTAPGKLQIIGSLVAIRSAIGDVSATRDVAVALLGRMFTQNEPQYIVLRGQNEVDNSSANQWFIFCRDKMVSCLEEIYALDEPPAETSNCILIMDGQGAAS